MNRSGKVANLGAVLDAAKEATMMVPKKSRDGEITKLMRANSNKARELIDNGICRVHMGEFLPT